MRMFRRERQSCSKCKNKRRAVKGQDADLPRAEVAAWHFFIDAVGSFLITMPEHGKKPKEGLLGSYVCTVAGKAWPAV